MYKFWYKAKYLKICFYSPTDVLCGFESSTLCGWTDMNIENETKYRVAWRYHDGEHTKNMIATKVRHDHTYGASKHAGTLAVIDMNFKLISQIALHSFTHHLTCVVKVIACPIQKIMQLQFHLSIHCYSLCRSHAEC